VLGIGLYSIALAFALIVWIPFLVGNERHSRSDETSGTHFTPEEIEQLKTTKDFDELIDTASELLKCKLEKRKQEEQELPK